MGPYFSCVAVFWKCIDDWEYSNSDLDSPLKWAQSHFILQMCISAWIILAHGTTKYNSIFVFGHTVILLFSSNQSQCIDTTQVYKLEAKFVSRHNKSYPRLDDKTVAVFTTCHVFRSSDSVPSSSSNLSKASLSSLRLSIQGLHKWKIPALPETRTAQTMLTMDTRFIRRRKEGSKLLNSSLKSIPLGVCQPKPCKYQASLRISHVVQTADKIFMLKCSVNNEWSNSRGSYERSVWFV